MMRRPYHAFVKKRLQTQSFIDTELSTAYMTELTSKIVSSLKSATREKANQKQKRQQVYVRIKTKQDQQDQSRQQLRSRIEDKMRASQTNLEKISQEKKKVLSSRSSMEESRRKKIKEEQRSQLEQSLVEVHKKQTETEEFFRQTQINKQKQYERIQNLTRSDRSRYETYYATNYNSNTHNNAEELDGKVSRSISSMNKSSKVTKRHYKINPELIEETQKRKATLEQTKQTMHISQYVAKMEDILNVRKKGAKDKKQPGPTLPKLISFQRESIGRKRSSDAVSLNPSPKKASALQRVSFNEQYMQKLAEKRMRKQGYHSMILQEGERILDHQHQQSKLLKQRKIMKQSLNEYQRWTALVSNIKCYK